VTCDIVLRFNEAAAAGPIAVNVPASRLLSGSIPPLQRLGDNTGHDDPLDIS